MKTYELCTEATMNGIPGRTCGDDESHPAQSQTTLRGHMLPIHALSGLTDRMLNVWLAET